MKYHFLVVSLIFCLNIHAQDLRVITGSAEDKADKYYQNFAYTTALGYYQDALKSDADNWYLYMKIGDCFRMLNNPDSTEKWYANTIEQKEDSVDAEYLLHYASALSSNQKYDKAKIWFKKYQAKAGDERRVKQRLEGLENISSFHKDSIRYDAKKLTINSKGLDFSPSWYGSGIVFVSNRKESPYTKSEYSWDKSGYLDLFYSDIDSTGQLRDPRLFNAKVNTKYHEGPVSFYDNDEKVVFTRNNYNNGLVKKSKDGTTKLKLYFASKEEGDWVNIEPFQYNDNEYSTGHPSISGDGDTMYFASDMPGGFGGTDIYFTQSTEGGWSQPKNLGTEINTEGNELFPFATGETLYFASNGHSGLGGLDVLKSEISLDNFSFSKPQNLGSPINSSYDDFGFIITENRKKGYFSSNREDKVNDNIYYFDYDPKIVEPDPIYVSGIVRDNHFGTPLSSSIVTLYDENGKALADTTSDVSGAFTFKLPFQNSFVLAATKLGFHEINKVTFGIQAVPANALINLEPPHHVISLRAIDKETGEYIASAGVHVVDIKKNEVIEISQRGDFHHEFETKGGHKYTALADHPDYFSSNIKDLEVGYDHEYDTLFFDMIMEKIVIGKVIKLNNIYYDLNKADIRSDAAIELDKLVELLVDNPNITIELSSHTDSRGKDQYNADLSQRRAESAVKYIIESGIDSERITAKGYGEEQLVNECENGVSCSKEKHQENRRTEFKVTSIK